MFILYFEVSRFLFFKKLYCLSTQELSRIQVSNCIHCTVFLRNRTASPAVRANGSTYNIQYTYVLVHTDYIDRTERQIWIIPSMYKWDRCKIHSKTLFIFVFLDSVHHVLLLILLVWLIPILAEARVRGRQSQLNIIYHQ